MALANAARRCTGSLVFHLQDGPVRLDASELVVRAEVVCSWLAARGIGPGDRVGLLGPNRPEWAVWAFGIWSAGAAVVPLQHPLRVRSTSALSERLESIIRAGGCSLVIADPTLASAVPMRLFRTWTEPARVRATPISSPGSDDPAVIQFTSGSTAAPKGALLTHGAVLAQIGALDGRVVYPSDVMLNWTPFFHDMGLFLLLVAPVLIGAESHVMPTKSFARDPSEWLRLVCEVQATYVAGPQSAWAAALSAAERRPEGIDLRSLEAAMFAAEGISPAFVASLASRGAKLGLSEGALATSYGLAEAVLAVTTSLRGHGIRVHRVDRDTLSREREARPPVGDTKFVASSGMPLPGTSLRIVRDEQVLEDDVEGEIQVRSISRMTGYVGGGPQPFSEEWLRTGDLGYLHDGELYVTGRAKDVLIAFGHNYHPEDFEWAAARHAGVRPGRCVAFVGTSSQRIVLLVEPSGAASDELATSVRRSVADAVGAAPGLVAVVTRGSIEKTTSGKLRRATMRSAFEQNLVSILGQAGSDA